MSAELIPELMQVLARELRLLAEATDGLHDVVCGNDQLRSQDVKIIQSIDHTQQTLANLSKFVEVLGEDMSQNLSVAIENALAGVTLADLKRRLSPQADLHGPGANGAGGSGELELFA